MTRMQPDARKADILATAVMLANTEGYTTLTREKISTQAQCSPSLITHYWPMFSLLLKDVMAEAVRQELPAIVAAGLVLGEPDAMTAPMGLKQLAADILLGV